MLDTLRRSLVAHGHRHSAGREVRIRVRGGYVPDTIHAETGVPLRLLFWREETSSCSEQVVFPDFGKSALLPTGEQVAVDLFPAEPGEYEFTCAMGMLHGRLIVEDRP
jgi:plastocyanin domain-containing protein